MDQVSTYAGSLTIPLTLFFKVVPPFDGGGAVGSNSMNGQRSMREKSLFLGLGITGAGRVSKANVEWEV